uniref:Uncharacterized protein n=1 Tax=Dulem virus 39 TaxID=3145757 RepID=A0AAU8B889_9CAUD
MEFLLYFLCGILCSEIILIYIFLLCVFMYMIFRLAFKILEKLEIENPIVAIYELMKKFELSTSDGQGTCNE